MKRITAIFSFIILLTLGSFAILWAVSPDEEKDRVMATQGIRLVGSAVFYNAENSTTPNRIKVGDLLIGSNEQVFRINEIRKSQSNAIYVVVSWKYITDYTTYAEYLSEPYTNYRTYELNSFAYNKTIIRESELARFYSTYSNDLAVRHEARRAEQAQEIAAAAPAPSAEPTPEAAPAAVAAVPPVRDTSAPRNLLRASNAETQVYATAEVTAPDDMTPAQKEDLQRVLSQRSSTEAATPRIGCVAELTEAHCENECR